MEEHYAFEREWRKMPVHDRPTHVSKQPWDERVRSPLFRAKRCRVLKELLIVKKAFLDSGYATAEEGERGKKFRVAMGEKKFRHSLLKLLQRMKSERVGINILEISVCGAIAPYNKLLGGKLVCMLMSSPQVQEFYRELYGQGESEIASSLKGEAVIKEPHLVGLSTMSLFSYKRKKGMKRKFPGGQYDHVRVPIYVSMKQGEFVKEFSRVIGKSAIIKNRLAGCIDRFVVQRGRGGTPLDFDAVAKLQSKLNELKNREKLGASDQEIVQKALSWLDDAIEYEDVGESSGWGSYHFSLNTIQKIRELAGVLGIRTVNSIFGEGISPKLRQMSQALSEMNLPPDELLQHRRIRTVYLVRLAKNFSDFCLGFDKEPIPKIPAKGNSEIITSEFARYWIWRWMSKRAKRSQTLDAIREDVSTRMPVRHGARVPMPHDDREDDLFPDL